MQKRTLAALLFGLGVWASGCGNSAKLSADRAVAHVAQLAPLASGDIKDVRDGMPEGAKHLASLWRGAADPAREPEAARDGLELARAKVQALRVAKSTFFALVTRDGLVVRSDQQQDMLAGKNVFEPFPALRQALNGSYVETLGSMHEARAVEGKPDGQWVAAQAIQSNGEVNGLYVTGWAWSHYARRLEEALKSTLLDQKDEKQPLFYVYVIVGKVAYGTRPAPEVNARAIEALDPAAHLGPNSVFRAELEITGRSFGLAAQAMPEFGKDVLVSVLRSET